MVRYAKFLLKRTRRALTRRGILHPVQREHETIRKMRDLKCNPFLDGQYASTDRSWYHD